MGNYKVFKFGSLYLDETPQKITDNCSEMPKYKDGQVVSIRDTVPGCGITWIETLDSGFLIADRNILCDISKGKLAMNIIGSLITLNGHLYRVRLPKVECTVASKTFWANFIYEVGKKAFHWHGLRSYGSEHNFDDWAGKGTSTDYGCGFRPVLEPIKPNTFVSGRTFVLEGQTFGLRQENVRSNRAGFINFTPVLYPLLTGKNIVSSEELVDCDVLQGISEMQAYTLLMDGKPVNQQTKAPIHYKRGAKLELTDKFFGKKYLITWAIKNGCAYTSKSILNSVPLEDLYGQDLL
mgnify:CR=1 FL=1